MELLAARKEVTRHNVGAESNFTFNINATAIRVMNDSLYQDKPGSIVRELSCNAVDAHVMAGCPEKPFVLHLPSELEPYLSIRDFGIGLDDAGVREVFCGYFNSTKRNSNAVIGAFGLGSKTPFSYTDQFTITATKDGTKRIYSAFTNEDGIPAVAILHEEETDEGNGVEVMVPVVDSADFETFKRAVAQQLRFFAVKPRITNGTVVFETISTIKIADGVELFNGEGRKAVWIVQGGVGYPANAETIKQGLSRDSAEFMDFLSGMGAVLTFPIGKIETTASREGVSYSKLTLANIEEHLTAVRSVVGGNMLREVEAMTTEWERAGFLNANYAYGKILKSNDEDVFDTLMPSLAPVNGYGVGSITTWGLHFDTQTAVVGRWTKEWSRRGRGYKVACRDSSQKTLLPAQTNIVIRDTTDKPVVRLTEYVNNAAGEVFVISAHEGVSLQEITDKLDAVGITGYTLLSTIPVPPRTVRISSNAGYTKPTAYLRERGDSQNYVKDWGKVVTKLKDIAEGGYYIVIPEYSRFEAESLDYELRFVFKLADNGGLDKEIYGIRERDVKRVADNPQWMRLDERAKEIVEEVLGRKASIRALAAQSYRTTFKQSSRLSTLLDALLAKMAEGDKDIPETLLSRTSFGLRLDAMAEQATEMEGWELDIVRNKRGVMMERMVNRFKRVDNAITNRISAAFPLLLHAPMDSTYGHGGYTYKIDAGMVEHLVKYVACIGCDC